MAKISSCPPLDELENLATGRFPPGEMEELLEHLESCEKCLGSVQRLSPSDTLIDVLTDARNQPDGPDEAIISRLIDGLNKLGKKSAKKVVTAPPTFQCSSCGKKLKTKAELAGKKVKCPQCGQSVQMPATPAEVCEEKTILPQECPAVGNEVARTMAPDVKDTVTAGEATKPPKSGVGGETEDEADAGEAAWDFLAPAEQPDEIGRLGPYRVLKVLGAGGHGRGL